MALATIADYEAITGTTLADPSAERTRVETLLGLSESAVLAGAHGQLIEQTTASGLVLRPSEGVVYLPQRPVVSITSVVYEGVTLTAGTDYRHTAGGDGRPALLYRVVDGRDSVWLSDVTVTYVSGWNPVPGQIRGMVVAMTVATMNNGGALAVSSHQETAGPFSETDTYSDAEVQAPNLTLTPSSQAALDRLCGLRAPTSVPAVRDYP